MSDKQTDFEAIVEWFEKPHKEADFTKATNYVGALIDMVKVSEANAALNRAMEVTERERAVKAESRITELEKPCIWKRQQLGLVDFSEYDSWGTSCGEDFAIIEEWDDKPTKFCSNCGHKTQEQDDV